MASTIASLAASEGSDMSFDIIATAKSYAEYNAVLL